MTNIVRLAFKRPLQTIIQTLTENHRERKIRAITVAYVYDNGESGVHEYAVEDITDITSLIAMLEINKSELIDHLKAHIT